MLSFCHACHENVRGPLGGPLWPTRRPTMAHYWATAPGGKTYTAIKFDRCESVLQVMKHV